MKPLPRKLETIIEPEPVAVMRCESCRGIMMNGRSRTVLDDSGSLAITAWKCSICGGVIEEIQILSRYRKTQPRRLRFAVAQQRRTRQLAPFALHCATRG